MLQFARWSRTPQGRFVRLLQAAWQEYERDHARFFAGSMVYYALVSLVPLVLLLLAILGLLLRFADFSTAAEQHVLRAVEQSLGTEFRGTIEHMFAQLRLESVEATIVSLIGLVWAASSLFRNLRLSFRAIWKHAPPLMAGPVRQVARVTLIEYVIAYLMVVIGGLVLVLAVVVVSITQWLGGFLIQLPVLHHIPGWLVALPGSVLLVGGTFALLFRFLPPVRVAWRDVWLATTLCTISWIIGAEIVVLVGVIFGQSPSASSAFGGLLVMMLWINVVCQLLFYGAELCKVSSRGDIAPLEASGLELAVGREKDRD